MKKKILILEDEPSIADNIRYALELEGFEVVWKSTLKDAGEFLKKNTPDLMILDIGLPDGSGFDFCREFRKKAQTPIIFLTARGEEMDRVVGLEIGADDYLTKPFSPRELAARVKAIFRRSIPFKTQPTKKLGPFLVDEPKAKISFFEKPLDLTRYEYRLLKALIENAGRILSRDQLMELAWESPESSLDRTVDAHIKTLRSKLKKANSKIDPIQTHRGMGYSMRDEW